MLCQDAKRSLAEIPAPVADELPPELDSLADYKLLVEHLAEQLENLSRFRGEQDGLNGFVSWLADERRTSLQALIHREESENPEVLEQKIAKLDIRREVLQGQADVLAQQLLASEGRPRSELAPC
jgi:hypothetical protein